MAPDDLTAPLGQKKKKKRRQLPTSAPQVLAGALGLFGLLAVCWAMFAHDPLGGHPTAVVATAPAMTGPGAQGGNVGSHNGMAAADQSVVAKKPMPPPGSRTVTIIDGSSGKHHDVIIPGDDGGHTPNPSIDKALLQKTH